MRIVKLDDTSKKNILNDLLKRSPNNYDKYADSVNEILQNVKENGNKAFHQKTLKLLRKKLKKLIILWKTLN